MNKALLMKNLRSAPAPKPDDPKTVYSAEDVQIHQYGDAAVVAFRLVATTTKNGSTEVSNYLNTGTFIKRNGRWQAVAWQSTAVPKASSK
jgi:ketosteroid isomerase-like protein